MVFYSQVKTYCERISANYGDDVDGLTDAVIEHLGIDVHSRDADDVALFTEEYVANAIEERKAGF